MKPSPYPSTQRCGRPIGPSCAAGGRKPRTRAECSPSTRPVKPRWVVTGLPWRAQVCQQVFEEAAVDCGRALGAWSDSVRVSARDSGLASPDSRREPAWWRRFGCATSTPRGAHRRSGLATTIGRVRSPCPVSGRWRCSMTPAGCDACWPRIGPRFCSPPSPITLTGGGLPSTWRPPEHSNRVVRHGAPRAREGAAWVGSDS